MSTPAVLSNTVCLLCLPPPSDEKDDMMAADAESGLDCTVVSYGKEIRPRKDDEGSIIFFSYLESSFPMEMFLGSSSARASTSTSETVGILRKASFPLLPGSYCASNDTSSLGGGDLNAALERGDFICAGGSDGSEVERDEEEEKESCYVRFGLLEKSSRDHRTVPIVFLFLLLLLLLLLRSLLLSCCCYYYCCCCCCCCCTF